MSNDEKLFVREGEAWNERVPGTALAEDLSRDLRTTVVEWSISTGVDQIWIVAYREGAIVRELRYASGEGWSKRGAPLPFENKAALAKWLRKRRLCASPDGYDVLDAFLGVQPPEPVVDPGANYAGAFNPTHAAELRKIAERAGVTVSRVIETSWHLGKQALYDRHFARAKKLGLNLAMLVEDTSPPPPLAVLPAFVHEPIEVTPIDLTRYAKTAIPHELAFSEEMLAELERLEVMFDVRKWEMLDDVYLRTRARLV